MDILDTILREWPVISRAPWSFAIALTVSTIVIAGTIIAIMKFTYGSTIDRQDHELASYRQKEQINAAKPLPQESTGQPINQLIVSKPSLKLLMLGANIFVRDDGATGIAVQTRVWNVGAPSFAADWTLAIIPNYRVSEQPAIAHFSKMPESLQLSGQANVIRATESLERNTANTQITNEPKEGYLLFYVRMPKDVVQSPTTRWELTVKDAFDTESITSRTIGDWDQYHVAR